MKRMLIFLFMFIVAFSIYYDITEGTLPLPSKATAGEEFVNEEKNDQSIPYFERKINRGDTVISIIEERLKSSPPVPIEQIVSDFKQLNNQLPPEKIQTGKTYKFPDYTILAD